MVVYHAISEFRKGKYMNIDQRKFLYAGTSVDSSGKYKARFANAPDARPKILAKLGHASIVLVELPSPMTKMEAVNWLLTNSHNEVVMTMNMEALQEKHSYLLRQIDILNGVPSGKKRGRPPLPSEIKQQRLLVKQQRAVSRKTVTSVQ